MAFEATKTAPEAHKGNSLKICDMEENYEFSFEALSRDQVVGVILRVSSGPWLEELKTAIKTRLGWMLIGKRVEE